MPTLWLCPSALALRWCRGAVAWQLITGVLSALLPAAGGEEAAQLGVQAQGEALCTARACFGVCGGTSVVVGACRISALRSTLFVNRLNKPCCFILPPLQSNVKSYFLHFEEAEAQNQIESRILEYQQRAGVVSGSPCLCMGVLAWLVVRGGSTACHRAGGLPPLGKRWALFSVCAPSPLSWLPGSPSQQPHCSALLPLQMGGPMGMPPPMMGGPPGMFPPRPGAPGLPPAARCSWVGEHEGWPSRRCVGCAISAELCHPASWRCCVCARSPCCRRLWAATDDGSAAAGLPGRPAAHDGPTPPRCAHCPPLLSDFWDCMRASLAACMCVAA